MLLTDYLLACGYRKRNVRWKQYYPGQFFQIRMSKKEKMRWINLLRKDLYKSFYAPNTHIINSISVKRNGNVDVYMYEKEEVMKIQSFITLDYFNTLRRKRIRIHALLKRIEGFTDDLLELIVWQY